jgi:hypothetical protein
MYLLVADIIGTLINTFTIRSILQGIRYIFDIRHTINDNACRPSQIALRNRIKIDCQSK